MTKRGKNDVFVGRQEELIQLHQLLNKVMKGRRLVTFLPGEAGTGKTTLIESFLQVIIGSEANVLIARGRCTNESELSGLTPFIEILGDLYTLDSGTGKRSSFEDDKTKRVLAFFKEVGPAWLDMITAGFASPIWTTIEEGRKLFAQQAANPTTFSQRTVFEQFRNLLVHKSQESPIVIFLDDLQWIDRSSLDLLFYLSRTLEDEPILIITAYRPSATAEKNNNLLSVMGDIIRFGGVELSELKQGIDVVDYAASRYPNHDFPSIFLNAIQERTEGYPLFVQQIFNWLEEQGSIEAKLVLSNGNLIGWHLKDASVVLDHIPQSVQAVISNRLHRLANNLREILTCASVEGEDFTVQVIAQLQKMDELDLLGNLDALDKQFHLVKEMEEKYLSLEKIISLYRFSHRLFRDYLYGNLPQAKKRVLHKQVAECLEGLYQGQLGLIAGQLATHYRLAHRMDKACDYSLLAAQVAYKSYSWVEAINWSKSALEQLKQLMTTDTNLLNKKAEAIIVWENCAERLGYGFDEVISELETLVEILQQREDLKLLTVRSLIALGWAYYSGPGLDSEKVLRQAQKLSEELGDLNIIYDANYLLAEALIDDSGKYQEALKILSEELEIAKKLGNRNMHADTLAILAWCYTYLGLSEESIKYGTESLHLLENYSESDPLILGFSYRVLGTAYHINGNYDQAIRMQEKSSALYARVGDAVQLNWCRNDMAETLCAQRRFEETSSVLREVILFAENTEDYPLTFWGYIDSVELNLESGDIVTAEENLRKAEHAFETYGALVDNIKLNTTYAIFCREKKDYQRSQNYIENTLSLLSEIQSNYTLLISYDIYGTILQANGDFAQAQEWYQKSINLSQQLNARVEIAATSQHLGALYLQQEQTDKARSFFQRALEIRQDLKHNWKVEEIQQSLNSIT